MIVTGQAKEAMGEAMGADRDALLKADEERMFKIQKVRVRACLCLGVARISLLLAFLVVRYDTDTNTV